MCGDLRVSAILYGPASAYERLSQHLDEPACKVDHGMSFHAKRAGMAGPSWCSVEWCAFLGGDCEILGPADPQVDPWTIRVPVHREFAFGCREQVPALDLRPVDQRRLGHAFVKAVA